MSLSDRELRVLTAMALNPGQPTPTSLLRLALGDPADRQPSDRAIGTLVARIRTKMQPDNQAPRAIQTIYGEGYALRVPTRGTQQLAGSVPRRLTGFVGRQDTLAELRAALCRSPLVALTGIGGVGKTRLAHELARQARAHGAGSPCFPDGVWFVSMEDRELVPALAEAVLPGQPIEDLEALAAGIRPKAALVVLDNVDGMQSQLQELAGLLGTEGPLHLVVTCRAPIEGLQALPVRGLPDHEAAALFEMRARHIDPTSSFRAEKVSRLCQQLGGVPLGMELAAGLLRGSDLDSILERLAQDVRTLAVGLVDLPPRHRCLAQLLESSWQALPAFLQSALAAAATFVGDFDRAASVAVLGEDAPLQTLVRAGLLEERQEGTTTRYALHPLVRELVDEHAHDATGLEARHRAWFAKALVQGTASLWGRDHIDRLAEVSLLLHEAAAAWTRALAADDREHIRQTAEAWLEVAQATGSPLQARSLLEAAWTVMPDEDTVMVMLANLTSTAGSPQVGLERLEGRTDGLSLRAAAQLLWARGRLEEAYARACEASDALATEERWAQRNMLLPMLDMLRMRRTGSRIHDFEGRIQACEASGDWFNRAAALADQAGQRASRVSPRAHTGELLEAAENLLTLNPRQGLRVLDQVAAMQWRLLQFEASVATATRTLELASETGNQWQRAWSTHTLARVLVHLDPAAAQRQAERCLERAPVDLSGVYTSMVMQRLYATLAVLPDPALLQTAKELHGRYASGPGSTHLYTHLRIAMVQVMDGKVEEADRRLAALDLSHGIVGDPAAVAFIQATSATLQGKPPATETLAALHTHLRRPEGEGFDYLALDVLHGTTWLLWTLGESESSRLALDHIHRHYAFPDLLLTRHMAEMLSTLDDVGAADRPGAHIHANEMRRAVRQGLERVIGAR